MGFIKCIYAFDKYPRNKQKSLKSKNNFMKLHNYQMRVYLNNLEKKNKFETTHSYKGVHSLSEAINIVRTMHTEVSDNPAAIARKIKRVVFNGRDITVFSHETESTNNGWLVK
jgi:hypothetical protein